MRDPARIGYTLQCIANVWAKRPDLRLGQLISNVLAQAPETNLSRLLFYIEDDKLIEALEEFERTYPTSRQAQHDGQQLHPADRARDGGEHE